MSKTGKILIVEDNAVTAFHLEKLLVSKGYEVPDHLSYAEELLEYVGKENPDVILLDVMLLGKMTGIEAARQLRESSVVPVIFISALTDIKSRDQMDEISFSSFVSKPFNEQILLSEIRKMLA